MRPIKQNGSMKRERLRVVKKIIRRAGQGRNVNTYCVYVVKNDNNRHKLKTVEGTKLFELLSKTVVSENKYYLDTNLYLDGVYQNDELIFVTNFRIV